MILGLTALGEGGMTTQMRVKMSATHTVGGIVGGAGAAVVLWIALTPIRTLAPPPAPATLAAVIAVACILIDVRVIKPRTLGNQVPQSWYARYGPVRSYGLYGLALGSAFVTFRPYSAVYAVFAVLGLLGSIEVAVLSGAAFGLARTGFIGPASLAATPVAKALYLAGPHSAWRAASIAVTCAALLVALQTRVFF